MNEMSKFVQNIDETSNTKHVSCHIPNDYLHINLSGTQFRIRVEKLRNSAAVDSRLHRLILSDYAQRLNLCDDYL